MSRKILLPAVAAAMLGFAVFHVVKACQQQPRKRRRPLNRRTPYHGTIAAGGIVEARSENIAIGSHLSGVVAEVFVNVNQAVYGPSSMSPGTPLFRLDDRQLRAELHVRQANLSAAPNRAASWTTLHRAREVPPLEARVRDLEAAE